MFLDDSKIDKSHEKQRKTCFLDASGFQDGSMYVLAYFDARRRFARNMSIYL